MELATQGFTADLWRWLVLWELEVGDWELTAS